MDTSDIQNKKEQEELRRKRKAAKLSKSESQKEKERKRKEHAKRILAKKKAESKGGSSTQAGDSAFQALFERRKEGFFIDLKFRNAPPRPPVGPLFVGPGLEGELQRSWTKFRPGNSIDAGHVWKLQDEKNLGIPITSAALDISGLFSGILSASVPIDENAGIHPEDEKILKWKGSMGDTAAEELQKRRDRMRAQGVSSVSDQQKHTEKLRASKATDLLKKKKSGSRVLGDQNQRWMMKTTYLTNDITRSVHQFKSQATVQEQTRVDLEKKLDDFKDSANPQAIAKTFDAVNGNNRSLQHPTKRGVTVVYDVPLLPDVATWGQNYVHVAIEPAPRGVSSNALERAMIMDTREKPRQLSNVATTGTERVYECNFAIPVSTNSEGDDEEVPYDVVQEYDLRTTPLISDQAPPTNYFIFVDKANKIATFRTIGHRLALSVARQPLGDTKRQRVVKRVAVTQEDIEEVEQNAAEVEEELMEKYGFTTTTM